VSGTEPPESSEPSEFSEFFQTSELPEPSSRPVSHRGKLQPAPILGRLLAPVTAVVVVIVVIVLLIWINGGSSGGGQSPAAVGPAATGATPRSHRPTLTPTASTAPATKSTKPTPTASSVAVAPSKRSKSPRTKHPKPAVPTAMAPVAVLNNSRIQGLAHGVAGQVQARGWTISAVGNLQGLVPETTVYYAAGDEPAAKHLAREFASIRRIEPNAEGNLHGAALTLVVTSDWGQ